MKESIKSVIAFVLLGALILAGTVLTLLDRTDDVYPDVDSDVMLYGERHGVRKYYEIELELWKDCYRHGMRSLFVELPYYSAEFLNLWMKEDSDEQIDLLFGEIEGTQSGNEYYYAFFHAIKESCPHTVFYGTDVGHQYDTTGKRYLSMLEEKGLAGTEDYALAEECIRQGEEFAAEHSATGISPVRESYMVTNFLAAYERCNRERIMGIYGSYHVSLDDPDVMAGALKDVFGDRISSVRLSTLAVSYRPYEFGLSVSGPVFLLMLFVPNILWAVKARPAGYEKAGKENGVLLFLERAGEILATAALLIFRCHDPCILIFPEAFVFHMRIFFWILSFLLMILYEAYWIRYFRSGRTMADFYASFLGFPVAGATLPVIALFLLGVYAGNLVVIAGAVVLGVGHIGIHAMHRKELGAAGVTNETGKEI